MLWFKSRSLSSLQASKGAHTCCGKEGYFCLSDAILQKNVKWLSADWTHSCSYWEKEKKKEKTKHPHFAPFIITALQYSRWSWKGADSFDCRPSRLSPDRGQCHRGSHYTPLPFAPLGNRHQKGAGISQHMLVVSGSFQPLLPIERRGI